MLGRSLNGCLRDPELINTNGHERPLITSIKKSSVVPLGSETSHRLKSLDSAIAAVGKRLQIAQQSGFLLFRRNCPRDSSDSNGAL